MLTRGDDWKERRKRSNRRKRRVFYAFCALAGIAIAAQQLPTGPVVATVRGETVTTYTLPPRTTTTTTRQPYINASEAEQMGPVGAQLMHR